MYVFVISQRIIKSLTPNFTGLENTASVIFYLDCIVYYFSTYLKLNINMLY